MIKFNMLTTIVSFYKSQLNITFFHILLWGFFFFLYVGTTLLFYSSFLSHSLLLMLIFLKGIEQHAAWDCDRGEKGNTRSEPQDCSSFLPWGILLSLSQPEPASSQSWRGRERSSKMLKWWECAKQNAGEGKLPRVRGGQTYEWTFTKQILSWGWAGRWDCPSHRRDDC